MVVLDDLVLDVTKFANSHPGGRFLIEKNRGKDISKFFHGGYNYEPNDGGWEHAHTNYARTIVSDLIIARLEQRRSSAAVVVVNKTVASKSGTVCNYELAFAQPEDKKPLDSQIKLFYSDAKMLGKHYLVQQIDNDDHVFGNARHYTVANCMRRDVYDAYVKALKGEEVDTSVITDKPDNCDLTLTIKEYNTINGLSKNIAINSNTKCFRVSGPMGKGLQPASSGLHVAFAAGTGVLVFVDLVAYLVRQQLELKSEDEEQDSELSQDFKFVLYASFASEDEAIALDFLQAASESLGDRFELRLRLSDGSRETSTGRWDSEFLDAEMSKLDDQPAKVWVCGTPGMNQAFEKAGDDLHEAHGNNPRDDAGNYWLQDRSVLEVL